VPGRPDLVVEIVFPSSQRYDRVTKLRWYAQLGVPEYWLVDAAARTLERLVLREGTYVIARFARRGRDVAPGQLRRPGDPALETVGVKAAPGAPPQTRFAVQQTKRSKISKLARPRTARGGPARRPHPRPTRAARHPPCAAGLLACARRAWRRHRRSSCRRARTASGEFQSPNRSRAISSGLRYSTSSLQRSSRSFAVTVVLPPPLGTGDDQEDRLHATHLASDLAIWPSSALRASSRAAAICSRSFAKAR
jgi:hypothetical protein